MSPRYYGGPAVSSGPTDPDPGPGEVTVTVESTTTLVTGTINGKDWHGRASMVVRPDGVVVLFYRSGSAHAVNDGALHVRFSDDYGATWTAEDTTLGGSPVTNFPMNPTPISAGEDAGEPWAIIAPSGDILLFMWRADYFVTQNGTYMARSTDGGETWTTASGHIIWEWFDATDGTHKRTMCTDDGFVVGTDIYITGRIHTTISMAQANHCLFKSTDDGATWERVSYLMRNTEGNGGAWESGIERVGATGMVAMLRDTKAQNSYQRVSDDLGLTWGSLLNVTSTVGRAGRQRVYTVDRLQGNPNPEDDPRLIMVGFVLQVAGSSQQRRNAVWVSLDGGDTWSAPFYIDSTSADGGYGDIFWDADNDEYVVVNYTGTLTAADLKQYRLTITGL